ncbi:MAG: YvcK family protein, partial [Deltaproteobacteria bacterium]|nr:YvcK family protein [Deltaproteobacteria bacterium]
GGTGLSNIIGGDSRKENWPEEPFSGLKDVFPQTKAIVCVTDDGGSTGELLKDLPFIALGDIRHVLLSSIRKEGLQAVYGLNENDCFQLAKGLHKLFNYRFAKTPGSLEKLKADIDFDSGFLPEPMYQYLSELLDALFIDPRLAGLLSKPHCLGNLLLAAAIWLEADQLHHKDQTCQTFDSRNYNGLKKLCRVLAMDEEAVMPCSLTPAGLQVLYTSGVLVTGEYKSGAARRGYPVDRLFVKFVEEPHVAPEVIRALEAAEIIILAPGSLYTSTIPIFQVPGIAETVRKNEKALKILVANLWVQKGETDVVREDPKRRFYVSDLIKAYNRNIPGGVRGLFTNVLSLGLQDISGSILQSYATEEKMPIFLDRENVAQMGFRPVEAGIYSLAALRENNVIQHDPAMLARAIRSLFAVTSLPERKQGVAPEFSADLPGYFISEQNLVQAESLYPCERYSALKQWLDQISITGESENKLVEKLSCRILDILWYHQDILLDHLNNIRTIRVIDRKTWSRSQEWDNVFSFYEPAEKSIRICLDVLSDKRFFEPAFLVALGQAQLGNYAATKTMISVEEGGESVGKVYKLTIKPPEKRNSFLQDQDLVKYLQLSRMIQSETNKYIFTRLVNGKEGFTPPGLLFGLLYAWYLDNRFAAHVEYKMAVMKNDISDLIPEQVKMLSRRKKLVMFFRQSVFCHSSQVYDQKTA